MIRSSSSILLQFSYLTVLHISMLTCSCLYPHHISSSASVSHFSLWHRSPPGTLPLLCPALAVPHYVEFVAYPSTRGKDSICMTIPLIPGTHSSNISVSSLLSPLSSSSLPPSPLSSLPSPLLPSHSLSSLSFLLLLPLLFSCYSIFFLFLLHLCHHSHHYCSPPSLSFSRQVSLLVPCSQGDPEVLIL